MNSYQQLVELIEKVKNEGVTPKVTKLPSTFNQKRKSMLVKK